MHQLPGQLQPRCHSHTEGQQQDMGQAPSAESRCNRSGACRCHQRCQYHPRRRYRNCNVNNGQGQQGLWVFLRVSGQMRAQARVVTPAECVHQTQQKCGRYASSCVDAYALQVCTSARFYPCTSATVQLCFNSLVEGHADELPSKASTCDLCAEQALCGQRRGHSLARSINKVIVPVCQEGVQLRTCGALEPQSLCWGPSFAAHSLQSGSGGSR